MERGKRKGRKCKRKKRKEGEINAKKGKRSSESRSREGKSLFGGMGGRERAQFLDR